MNKAICVIGAPDGAAPLSLKAFTNREDLDFSSVSTTAATQAWDLQENLRGDIEYPTSCALVQRLHAEVCVV